MARTVTFEVDVPDSLGGLRLPFGVDQRLQALRDRQTKRGKLSHDEQLEAEGLADLAELLSVLRLRSQRLAKRGSGSEIS